MRLPESKGHAATPSCSCGPCHYSRGPRKALPRPALQRGCGQTAGGSLGGFWSCVWRQPFPRDMMAAIPRFTLITTGQQEARGAQASGWRERTQQRRSSVRDCKSISVTVKKPDERGPSLHCSSANNQGTWLGTSCLNLSRANTVPCKGARQRRNDEDHLTDAEKRRRMTRNNPLPQVYRCTVFGPLSCCKDRYSRRWSRGVL